MYLNKVISSKISLDLLLSSWKNLKSWPGTALERNLELCSGMMVRPKSTFFGRVNGCRRKKKKRHTRTQCSPLPMPRDATRKKKRGLNLCHGNPENMCPKTVRGKKFRLFFLMSNLD